VRLSSSELDEAVATHRRELLAQCDQLDDGDVLLSHAAG
jgi:hypothetical protein